MIVYHQIKDFYNIKRSIYIIYFLIFVCNLDKFTKNEISKRAVNETINDNLFIDISNK